MAKMASKSPEELETLAGEYVVGLLDADERHEFEALAASVTDASDAQLRWENRLTGLNDAYAPVTPAASVKSRLDEKLFASTALTGSANTVKGGLWNALGFWRGLGVVGSAAAVAFGVYSTRLNDGLTDTKAQLTAALEEKQEIDGQLKAFEGEIASRGEQLAALEAQISEERERATSLQSELASAQQRINEADGLLRQARANLEDALNRDPAYQVVSLESGETEYRFLAVHEQGTEEVRMTLVAGQIEAQQDYELWLVEPEKETISLGVVASGKSAVDLTVEQAAILEKGGLLAISIETKGGSPTGVAQGPVVALGAPQEL
jgi:anti-sigma-K factor RskA